MAQDFQSSICVAGFVLMILLSLVTVIANGLLLLVLYMDPLKCFRNHNSVYIITLAVLDLLSGVLSCTFVSYNWIDCVEGKTNSPELSGYLSVLPFQFSITAANFVVLLFSCSRLVSITFPFHYRRSASTRRSVACVCTIFVASIFMVLVQLLPGISHANYLFVLVHVYVTCPFVLLLLTNAALIVALKKSKKKRRLFERQGSCSKAHVKRSQAERTLALTGILVVVFFGIALIPFYVFVLVQLHCENCTGTKWYFAGRRLSLSFILTNSAVNPFLYVFLLPRYRRACWAMYVRLRCWRRDFIVKSDSSSYDSKRFIDTRV